MTSRARYLVYGCLFLSGSTSLAYELLWTRILSFSLGSTSMAFAAVLAVFFLGLAGGSLGGGRRARKLRDPFRVYGLLELAAGLSAAILFPLLFQVHRLFALVNAGGGEPAGMAFRFLAAGAALAVPTLAMGATMPILLEHVRRRGMGFEAGMGRLYGANTLGAFFGVYLATHWTLPRMGLEKAYFVTVAINVAVFAIAWLGSGSPAAEGVAADATDEDGARAHRGNLAVTEKNAATAGGAAANTSGADEAARFRLVGLILLGTTGFTTLGYEVAWGRVLTIAMEGSIYGIGATLGSFLAGIGLGGLAFAWAAKRLGTPARLFRAYVVIALCIVAYLAASRLALPIEGYLLRAVTFTMRNTLGLHLNFLIAILALLPITGGFGFLFPAAVAMYNHGLVDKSRGAGVAYGLNTACSVLGSLLSASYLMDKLGIEGLVFLNALLLILSLAVTVLLAEPNRRARAGLITAVLCALVLTARWWPEIDAKTVLVNSYDGKRPSLAGLFRNLAANFAGPEGLRVYKDGVGSTVTVTLNGRTIVIQSNGLTQSGKTLDPPFYNMESSLVGLLPAIHRPDARQALVIGLGAGITTGILRKAAVPRVEVVELEPAMPAICMGLYPPGQSPLDDSGVTLYRDDARNFLVRNLYRKRPMHWDIIASQPAHPWVSGAADLFTEDMFRLVYRNLDSNGVFCQWFIPGGLDEEAFASIQNAFGRVFAHAVIYRTIGEAAGFYFIGSKGPAGLDLAAVENLFRKPGLRQLLDLNKHAHPRDVLRYAVTGMVTGAQLQGPGPVNRDANAFIETRMPLLPKDRMVRLSKFPGSLFTGLLPGSFIHAGQRESLFVFGAIDAISGNLPGDKQAEGDSVRLGRLALFARNAPPPYSDYYRIHLAMAANALRPDSLEALAARSGTSLLRYQLRYLRLRKWPAFQGPALPDSGVDSLPAGFRLDLCSQWMLADAESGRFAQAEAIAARYPVDSAMLSASRLLRAFAAQDARLLAPGQPGFRALYARCLTDWNSRTDYLRALQWYCAATGRTEQAKAIEGTLATQANQEMDRVMAKASLYKGERNYPEAVRGYSQALALNPAFFNAYLGLAESYGGAGQRQEFSALLQKAQAIFPIDEVYAFRLREVFEQGGRSFK